MTGPAHASGPAAEELRLLGLALLDRFEPGVQSVLMGLRVEAAEAAEAAGAEPDRDAAAPAAEEPCRWCPVCATIAVVRGDRPELAGKVAEHTSGLLSALRAVLEQPTEPGDTAPAGPPPVQKIRVDHDPDGAARDAEC